MSLSSKTYFRFAQEAEESMNKEIDLLKKKEYRKVAAQNYFYSAMEAIESVLKKSGIDLYSINNHEERLHLVKMHRIFHRFRTGGVKLRTPPVSEENSGTPKEPPRAKRASRRSVTGGGRFLFEETALSLKIPLRSSSNLKS